FLGWWQERKLNQEIAVLREKGEPILPEDFKSKAIADEENAAEVLMRAAKLIDGSSKTMERFSYIALELPLSERELAIVRPALAENREALAMARQARSRKLAEWKIEVKSPLMLVVESSL